MYDLFVYGTLLEGLERHSCLADSVRIGTGILQARLYDLGNYPGIKDGDLQVRGELYAVSAETLKLIDQVEGYDEQWPEQSLFERRLVPVSLDCGNRIMAYCYYYAGPVDEDCLIEDGDYLGYRERQADSDGKN